LNQNKACPLCI